MKTMPKRTAIVVFLAFAFAYFFSALIRAITATLSPTLTQEFALNARDLGLLAGGYFLGFAATQLPLGTWLDRHGPKKVILYFLTVAVLGCVAFSLATSFVGLLAARILCGVGVSACLMAPLTGYRRWLQASSQMRANSWMLMTGSFGMVASTLPVQWLMPLIGWRVLFLGLAVLVLLAMVLLAWQVPKWDAALTRVWAGALLALYCVGCTFASLAQPAVAMAFAPALAGRALSAYNLVIFAGVFVVQWGVGLAVDGFKVLGLTEIGAFQAAMGVFLLCSVAAYGYFLTAKSHNQPI